MLNFWNVYFLYKNKIDIFIYYLQFKYIYFFGSSNKIFLIEKKIIIYI